MFLLWPHIDLMIQMKSHFSVFISYADCRDGAHFLLITGSCLNISGRDAEPHLAPDASV